MRINQWIAHNTIFSRREADRLIKDSKVKIGYKIAMLNDKVNNERVFIDGKEIKPTDKSKYSVIVYHKPKGELVSKVDDRNRKVVFDTLDKKFAHYIPVGRLDYASSGLLLLTDNPTIATALMNSNLTRIYNIKVNGKIDDKILKAVSEGLILENACAGGHKHSKITAMSFAPFELFEVINETKHYTKIKVGITEGKNRELRRFFAHFGLQVIDLKRVSYGFVELNSLPCAKSRYLSRKDYNKLRVFLSESNIKLESHYIKSKKSITSHLNMYKRRGSNANRNTRK